MDPGIRIRIRTKMSRIPNTAFFYQKLQLTSVQAPGEAFSPQKEHPSPQKMKYITFFYVCGNFCPP